jgi:hypothetical protein
MDQGKTKSIFAPTEFWRIVIVAVILICGLVTRLYDLTDPPLDYSATRQLRSAMIARGKYYAALDDAPEWKRDIAGKQERTQEVLEPTIIEDITVATYLIVGGEYIWIARIYSSLFWVLGGLALYSLTRSMVSDDGAIIALIYYLFVPFGLVVSRTFQPDSLMVTVILMAWLTFHHWYRTGSWKWAILAGISAGTAMYIKSISLFFLLIGMAVIVLTGKRIVKVIQDAQVWAIALISGIPVTVYNIYGIFISKKLAGTFKTRFFPEMWDDLSFYKGWMDGISTATGSIIILAIGLAGLFLIQNKKDKLFLLSIWIGYIVYGFGFSYHVTTHKYYHLPLIPLLAVTLGAVSEWIFEFVRKKNLSVLVWIGTALIVILGVAGGHYIFMREDFRHEPYYYSKVASFVNPEDKIVALSQDYGFRLSYYGWIAVHPWFGTEDEVISNLRDSEEEPFSKRFSQFSTEYDYFIVTRMKEFRRQEQLFDELNNHYPITKEEGGFVIFNLRERID